LQRIAILLLTAFAWWILSAALAHAQDCGSIGHVCAPDHTCDNGICRPRPADPCAAHDPFLPTEQELAEYGLSTGISARDEHCAELALVAEDVANGFIDTRVGPSSLTDDFIGSASATGGGAAICAVLAQTLYNDSGACGVLVFYAPIAVNLTNIVLQQYSDHRRFGPAGVNAVRHFLWTALVSAHFTSSEIIDAIGKDKTLTLTGIHEWWAPSCPGTEQECVWDDDADHNNNNHGTDLGEQIQDLDFFGRMTAAMERATHYLDTRTTLDLRGGCPSRHGSIPQGC